MIQPIILFDDRDFRQKSYSTGRLLRSLDSFECLYLPDQGWITLQKNNFGKAEKNNSNKVDFSDFEKYSIIMIHNSSLKEVRNAFVHHCRSRQRPAKLVLFSGGIPQSSFHDEGDFQLLEINSGLFYHDNLISFLETVEKHGPENVDLREIQFGPKWEIDVCLQIKHKAIRLQLAGKNTSPFANEFKALVSNIRRTGWDEYSTLIHEIRASDLQHDEALFRNWIAQIVQVSEQLIYSKMYSL